LLQFNLFVPTELQPVDELKPTDHLFVIPGVEIPEEAGSFAEPPPPIIEDWEETFNVNAPLVSISLSIAFLLYKYNLLLTPGLILARSRSFSSCFDAYLMQDRRILSP
jgi:hypothetical protein